VNKKKMGLYKTDPIEKKKGKNILKPDAWKAGHPALPQDNSTLQRGHQRWKPLHSPLSLYPELHSQNSMANAAKSIQKHCTPSNFGTLCMGDSPHILKYLFVKIL